MSNNNNLEIEKKFLIKYPNFEYFNFNKKIKISQSYLIRENPEIERRIRSWNENNSTKYYYTEKRFLTDFTREEIESEITKNKYVHLKSQIDSDLVTVEKTRYTTDFNHLTFEIDVYPFSTDYAIMEVELENIHQNYTIPPQIDVIKEVTGIKEYSNISLCTSQFFPNI